MTDEEITSLLRLHWSQRAEILECAASQQAVYKVLLAAGWTEESYADRSNLDENVDNLIFGTERFIKQSAALVAEQLARAFRDLEALRKEVVETIGSLLPMSDDDDWDAMEASEKALQERRELVERIAKPLWEQQRDSIQQSGRSHKQ